MTVLFCKQHECKDPPAYKIICGPEELLGCEIHALELAGPFYQNANQYGIPKFERLNAIPKPVCKIKTQVELINKNNVGTGKADQFNVARALRDEAKLDECGFPKLETYFAVGTPLATSGVDAFRRERQKFDKLPKADIAMQNLIKQIQAEERHDIVINLKSLKAEADHTVNIPEYGKVYIANRSALRALMNFTPLGMNISRYLSKCSGDLRAANLNYWLQQTDNDISARLRLRKGPAGKELFAVVSTHYTSLDIDKVAEIVGNTAHTQARAEVIYDGAAVRIQLLYHTDVKPEAGVVGEVFKVGTSLRTDDTGAGSISGRAVAWRALCLNFTNMMTSREIGRRKHIGDIKMIQAAVKRLQKDAQERVDPFLELWGQAQRENILETAVSIDAGEKINIQDLYGSVMGLFSGALERELIPVRGRRHEQVMELVSAWEKEPGPGRTHFVNAITRYAHETEQSSPWDEDEFQDAASDILFSKKPLPYVNPVKSML